jgi:hypothetical protein
MNRFVPFFWITRERGFFHAKFFKTVSGKMRTTMKLMIIQRRRDMFKKYKDEIVHNLKWAISDIIFLILWHSFLWILKSGICVSQIIDNINDKIEKLMK